MTELLVFLSFDGECHHLVVVDVGVVLAVAVDLVVVAGVVLRVAHCLCVALLLGFGVCLSVVVLLGFALRLVLVLAVGLALGVGLFINRAKTSARKEVQVSWWRHFLPLGRRKHIH